MLSDVVLVRHGQSEGNLANKRSRTGDDSAFTDEFLARSSATWRLTDKGIAQAQAAGDWLRRAFGEPFDVYLTSEHHRCLETSAHLELPAARFFIEPLLREQVGDLRFRLTRPLGDLQALIGDLGVEDLELALGADVLAGGHREHPREGACQPGHDHREGVRRGARDRGHDRQRGHQPVLGAEHDLADLAQPGARSSLLLEVRRQPVPRVGGGRRIGTGFAPTRSPKLRRISGQVLK